MRRCVNARSTTPLFSKPLFNLTSSLSSYKRDICKRKHHVFIDKKIGSWLHFTFVFIVPPRVSSIPLPQTLSEFYLPSLFSPIAVLFLPSQVRNKQRNYRWSWSDRRVSFSRQLKVTSSLSLLCVKVLSSYHKSNIIHRSTCFWFLISYPRNPRNK